MDGMLDSGSWAGLHGQELGTVSCVCEMMGHTRGRRRASHLLLHQGGVDVSLSDRAAALETVLSHTPSHHLRVCVYRCVSKGVLRGTLQM